MKSFFISFAIPNRNLGCVITQADTSTAALERVTQLGLNPGGEVAIWRSDEGEAKRMGGYDKLVSPDTMRALGYQSRKDVTPEKAASFMDNVAARVCEDCNNNLHVRAS